MADDGAVRYHADVVAVEKDLGELGLISLIVADGTSLAREGNQVGGAGWHTIR